MNSNELPIAVSSGEPGGIGPEVSLRAALALSSELPIVICGRRGVLLEAFGLLGPEAEGVRLTFMENIEEASLKPGTLWALEPPASSDEPPASSEEEEEFVKGRPSAEGGRAAVEAIRLAAGLAQSGRAAAVTTAPIAKESLQMAGFAWPGHTELLSDLTGAPSCSMVLFGGPLAVILATIHTSLRSVPDLINKTLVLETIKRGDLAARLLGAGGEAEPPRLAVAGLNPHAGEAGMFGDEDAREIEPAIEEARAEGLSVEGPLPPDTVFFRAARGEFDMVVCMYHDQGLIPLKLLAFETGVNFTAGLPIIRTSPDHGTAFPLAWGGGEVDARSMIEAIRSAARISENRRRLGL